MQREDSPLAARPAGEPPEAAVSDDELEAVARYLGTMGVPELSGGYFPVDTHRTEIALLIVGAAFWLLAIVGFFVVVSAYGTPAYGQHALRWYVAVLVAVFVGSVTLLMRRELRLTRVGGGRPRSGVFEILRSGVEAALWILAIVYWFAEAARYSRGDPGSIVLLTILLAGFLYRFPLRRFTGRNVVTFGLATLHAFVEGAKDAPKVAATVPWMLGAVLFLFIAGDAWRLFGRMEDWRFWTLSAILVVAVLVGMRSRLPNPLTTVADWNRASIAEHVTDTPAAALAQHGVDPVLDIRTISMRTRINLVGPVWLARSLRILTAAIALAVILLAFGFAAIGHDQTVDLVGSARVNIVPVRIDGVTFILSDALVRVSILLSMFGATYFAFVTLADPRSRAQFDRPDESVRMSRALAVYAYYSGALRARGPLFTLWGRPVYRHKVAGMDLRGADLSTARLDGVDLAGARASRATKWPAGFDPDAHGVRTDRAGIIDRVLRRAPASAP